jgi:hypothetical protein
VAPIDHAVLIKVGDFQKLFREPPWWPSDIVIFEQAVLTP